MDDFTTKADKALGSAMSVAWGVYCVLVVVASVLALVWGVVTGPMSGELFLLLLILLGIHGEALRR